MTTPFQGMKLGWAQSRNTDSYSEEAVPSPALKLDNVAPLNMWCLHWIFCSWHGGTFCECKILDKSLPRPEPLLALPFPDEVSGDNAGSSTVGLKDTCWRYIVSTLGQKQSCSQPSQTSRNTSRVWSKEQSMEEVSALNLRIAHTARQSFPLGSLKEQKFSSIGPRLRKNISKLKFTTEEKPTFP